MTKIVLLGTGNVAKHLYDTMTDREDFMLVQVVGRNQKALQYFKKEVQTTTDFTEILDADIYIIAVSDDAISLVSHYLSEKKGLVVHTSGSVPLKSLSDLPRSGVFYPLQTFREGQQVNFKTIPICIEVAHGDDLEVISLLANAISDQVYEITSEQRKYVHLAAVFINNFTNHIYHLGQEICEEHQLPFSILKPLLMETARKISKTSPYDAQTGPAKRQDTGTIEKHLSLLNDPHKKNIYTILSQSIQDTYGKKL